MIWRAVVGVLVLGEVGAEDAVGEADLATGHHATNCGPAAQIPAGNGESGERVSGHRIRLTHLWGRRLCLTFRTSYMPREPSVFRERMPREPSVFRERMPLEPSVFRGRMPRESSLFRGRMPRKPSAFWSDEMMSFKSDAMTSH